MGCSGGKPNLIIADLLIGRGADPNGEIASVPLLALLLAKDRPNLAAIKFVITRGANVNYILNVNHRLNMGCISWWYRHDRLCTVGAPGSISPLGLLIVKSCTSRDIISDDDKFALLDVVLAAGADPNPKTGELGQLWTPLMLLCDSTGCPLRCIQLLMAHGADPCATVTRGGAAMTALIIAQRHGNQAIVTFLQDAAGCRPLQIAVEHGLFNTACTALRFGRITTADCTLPNLAGQHSEDALKLLRSLMHPWPPESHAYYHPGFREVVATLMCIKQRQNRRTPMVLPGLTTIAQTTEVLMPQVKVKNIRAANRDQ